MRLKKSVKLMKKLLNYPPAFKCIELTTKDYQKHKKHIEKLTTMFSGKVDLLYDVPVICRHELKESVFIVSLPNTYRKMEDGKLAPAFHALAHVKADLSYMKENIEDKNEQTTTNQK